jgi:hypothetical protein
MGLIGEAGDCGCWWYLELADLRSTSSEEPQYSPHGVRVNCLGWEADFTDCAEPRIWKS